MKRKNKLTLLGILLVVALTFGCMAGFTAFAETMPETPTTNIVKPSKEGLGLPFGFWGGSFDGTVFTITDTTANGDATSSETSSNQALTLNRYNYKIKITDAVVADGVPVQDAWSFFMHVGGASIANPRPYSVNHSSGINKNGAYLAVRQAGVEINGTLVSYNRLGANLLDGKVHEIDFIVDADKDLIYFWVDDNTGVAVRSNVDIIAINAFTYFTACDSTVEMSSIVAGNATMETTLKPANKDALSLPFGFWVATYENDKMVLSSTGVSEAASNQPLKYNRYTFTLKFTNPVEGAEYRYMFHVGGVDTGSPRVVPAFKGAYLIVFDTYLHINGVNVAYSTMGVNLMDGKVHEVDFIVDDATDTVYAWFDNYLVTVKSETEIVMDNTNSHAWFVNNGITTEVCDVRAGYTTSKVAITGTDESVVIEDSLTLTATAYPESVAANAKFTWTSSDEEVATVKDGVVTGVKLGTATIRATAQSGAYGEYTVTVTDGTVAIEGITLNKTETTIEKDQTETLTATLAPVDTTQKNLTWTSSNEEVATVENGVVTAVGVGTATITVTSTANAEVKAECAVTVTPVALTALEVPETLKVEIGSTVAFNVVKTPANADDVVTVTVEDETVVTYADGKFTALKVGTTKVTVAATTAGITKECAVTVYAPTKPEGMPEYSAEDELAYIMGCDPSVSNTLEKKENGFKINMLTSYAPYFPMNGDAPNTTYSMNAVEFGIKVDSDNTDWCAVVLFRTASPSLAFFSNNTGISLRLFKDRTDIVFHYYTLVENPDGQGYAQEGKAYTAYTANVGYVDNTTHYFAMEMSEEGCLTVWADGEVLVDAVDLTDYFGKKCNVSENNSISFTAYKSVVEVSDFHIYDTTEDEVVTPDPGTSDTTTEQPSASEDPGTSDTTTEQPSASEDPGASDTTTEQPSASEQPGASDTTEKSEVKGCFGAAGISAGLLSVCAMAALVVIKRKKD